MANKIIYLQWGDRYGQEDIDKLYDRVNKNCSVDYEFTTIDQCYASRENDEFTYLQKEYYRGSMDVNETIGSDNGILREDLGGCAHCQKMNMFFYDNELFDDKDTLLYIDLDSKINKDLAYFFDLDMQKPWLAGSGASNDEWRLLFGTRQNPLYNSSVILWKVHQLRKLWNDFYYHRKSIFFQYGMIDNWLWHRFGPYSYDGVYKNYFNVFDSDVVGINNNESIISTYSGFTMEEKKECLK